MMLEGFLSGLAGNILKELIVQAITKKQKHLDEKDIEKIVVAYLAQHRIAAQISPVVREIYVIMGTSGLVGPGERITLPPTWKADPESLVALPGPAGASWAPNRLDCFVRGQDYHMWQKWWDGSAWHDWVDLGGTLTSAPAAVSWGPNRIDCFIRDENQHLSQKWWDGSTWRGWADLGGILA